MSTERAETECGEGGGGLERMVGAERAERMEAERREKSERRQDRKSREGGEGGERSGSRQGGKENRKG